MKKLIIAAIITLISFTNASATHLMGGEITYTHVAGDTYEVTLKVYRDCSGANLGNSFNVSFASSCVATLNVNFPLIQTIEVSQLCPTSIGSSTCGTGSLPGTEMFVYRQTVTMIPCVDWQIYWSSGNRNPAITNLVNPNSSNIFIMTTLNNVVGAQNNSPQYLTIPTPYLCANQLMIFNHGASDADGDSLYYSFSNPYTTPGPPGTPMSFTAGYTLLEPMLTTAGMNLDQETGEMCFTPSQAQVSVVSVLVQEFRNNILIGTQIREMQVVVDGSCTNQSPIAGGVAPGCGQVGGMVITVQGPFVTQVDSNSIIMCPDDSLCFEVNFSDPDGDNITITSNVATAIPGATFTVVGNGTPNAIATFCWVPTSLDFGLNVFAIQAQDDACPISAISTFTYDITVNERPYAGEDQFICASALDTVQLLATGGLIYTWSVLSGDTDLTHLTCLTCDNPGVFPDSTTTYLLTSTGTILCSNTDTITIFVGLVPKPIISDTSYCIGDTVFIDAGIGFGGMPYDSLLWGGTVIDTGQVLGVFQQGNYYTIAWQGGCGISSDTITVTENPLPVPIISTPSGIFHYCINDSITLTVQTGFDSYLWSISPNDTTNTIIAGSGTSFITVIDTNGCIGTSSQLVTQSDPQVTILGADSICPDSTLLLSASPSNFSSYEWSNGDTNPSTFYTVDSITLVVTDNFGCTDTATTNIYVYPTPNAAFTISPEFFGSPGAEIEFTDNSSGNPIFWNWNFGDGLYDNNQNTTHIYEIENTYTIILIVTNSYGCKDTTSLDYFVGDIIIPNVFTPNGDGDNDLLEFSNVDKLENHLEIFNRWGLQVFEQTNYQNDWDGDNLKEGTYFFVLDVTLPDGEQTQFKGTITLFR